MTSCLVMSLFFINKWYLSPESKSRDLNFGLLLFFLATIFKSYAIIFLPVLLFLLLKKKGHISQKIKVWNCLCLLMVCLPVLYWHYWTSLQPGYHDSSSHNILRKLEHLLQAEYYYAIYKHLVKFLGLIPFYALLLFSIYYLAKNRLQKINLPEWFLPYTICLGLFLIAVADKIPQHEYYFLLGVPIFFYLSSGAISALLSSVKVKPIILIVILLIHVSIGTKSYLKATKENPDVLECAKMITDNTEEQAKVGIYTDVSRFNSINYYANRSGVVIEGDKFNIEVYKKHGIKYLVTNLNSRGNEQFENWIRAQSDRLKLSKKMIFKDAKKREMSCLLYKVI